MNMPRCSVDGMSILSVALSRSLGPLDAKSGGVGSVGGGRGAGEGPWSLQEHGLASTWSTATQLLFNKKIMNSILDYPLPLSSHTWAPFFAGRGGCGFVRTPASPLSLSLVSLSMRCIAFVVLQLSFSVCCATCAVAFVVLQLCFRKCCATCAVAHAL